MGIRGLLQSLRPIERPINISEYKGKTVAIDGHCILHRGCFGAATDLALNKPTESYVEHFMHYIGLFQYHGVIPIVVFDGLPLPLKQGTNDERRRRREEALKEGLALHKQGRVSEAEKLFRQAVTISDEMIKVVIRKLITKKVQCIVAPNEADAQLAHLIKTGKAEAVVTEDSDLLAFGCNKCIYKIDRYGDGVELSLDQLFHNVSSAFYDLDVETFRHICILSGCDYLPSLKGFGLKTILTRYNLNKNTVQTLLYVRLHIKSREFPSDYFEKFYLANLGFLHQWVYDIDEQNYVRLNPLPSECSPQDILLLGRIPTIQDSTMYRVNRVVTKMTTSEAITNEFIAYVDSVKENIVPHAPSSLSKPCKKSPQKTVLSEKSSSSIMKPKNAGPLTERRSPQQRPLRIPAAAPIINHVAPVPVLVVVRDSNEQEPTQSESLNAFYFSKGVFPRSKSKTAAIESAAIESADIKPAAIKPIQRDRRVRTKGIPEAPSDVPAHYMAEREYWIADQKRGQLIIQSVETTKDRICRVRKSKEQEKAIAREQIAAQDSYSSLPATIAAPCSSSPSTVSSTLASPDIIHPQQNLSYTPIISTTPTSSTTSLSSFLNRKRSFDHQSDHYSRPKKHLRCLR